MVMRMMTILTMGMRIAILISYNPPLSVLGSILDNMKDDDDDICNDSDEESNFDKLQL